MKKKPSATGNGATEQSSPTPSHPPGFWWRFYEGVLRVVVARPLVVLVLVTIVMLALAALGLTLRRDFFSPVERDQFVVDVVAPQGSSVKHTAGLVKRAESLIAAHDGVVSVASFVGRNAPLVFYNLTSQETYANHFAQLIVNVADLHQTTHIARDIQHRLRAEVAGAEWCAHILEHGAPFVAPFEVRISGPSIPTLRELGRRAAVILKQTPGVRNIRHNYGHDALKLVAEVNEPVARRFGVDQLFIARELRQRLDGVVATDMQEGDERIDISVRLAAQRRDDFADLNAIHFKPSPDTGRIPFSTVATLDPRWEVASIYRRDTQRTLSVLAYPEFGPTPAQVSKRFAPRLAALTATLPEGYKLELGGENEQRHEAETNLIRRGAYTMLLIVLLLMVEFRSFRLTALILLAIPLSVGGAMLGLWLTGWPLNFMAIMGLMMLAGVVINDDVILVDGYEKRRLAGEPVAELIIPATLERTRHVVITTVTTVAGFLPLALTESLLWPPLAIVVIGGLGLGTLVTLVGVPAGYRLLRR